MAGIGESAAMRRATGCLWGGFGFIGLFSGFINLLMLVGPLYMLQIYDRVLTSGSGPTLLYLTVVAVFLILGGALLDLVRARLLLRLGARFDHALGETAFRQTVRASAGAAGAPIRPLADLETVRGFLTGAGPAAFFDAPWVPVFLFITFLFHPILGFIALAGAIVLFAMSVASELVSRRPVRDAVRARQEASARAEDCARNAETVEAMGMMDGLARRWAASNGRLLALQARVGDHSGLLTAGARFVRPVLQVAILGAGAWLVLGDRITPGTMIAASIIMARALAPVEQAIQHWRGFVGARQAFGRLDGALKAVPEPAPRLELPRPVGALGVEKLIAAAPGGRTPILRGVSFALDAGETLGIIGPSGAGKSTLLRLIAGVWKPLAGKVRLDGADIADRDRARLGRHIGYLPQEVGLFDGTVAENICRFGDLESAAIVAAARKAGLHDFILGLPGGYDTPLGRGGLVLSGGQRQRLGLARALYGSPVLVLLDEPASNLDAEGETALHEALHSLRAEGVTTVLVAHRPSAVATADRLLVLREGKVEKFGRRDEILPKVVPGAHPALRPIVGDRS